MPFNPIELVHEAQRAWLGFDATTSPDINVVAYATDGRPEPRIAAPRIINSEEVTRSAVEKLGLRESAFYDDYEEYEAPDRVVSKRITSNAKKRPAQHRNLVNLCGEPAANSGQTWRKDSATLTASATT